MNNPLVSIMMATYNRAEFLPAAIASVLAQDYSNWELLILDDASTDNSSEVVKRLAERDSRILYLPSPVNLGITKNRNRGLKLARGKYIAVLDSDDLWIDPTKLGKQVAFLESNIEHVLVGTNVKVIDVEGETTGRFDYATDDQSIRSRLLMRNQFTHSSVLFRASALDGGYDPTLPIWEDYELILRLGLAGQLANLPEQMTAYRKHSSNVSKTTRHNGGKVHLSVMRRYRHKYPGYPLALLKGYLRLIF